MLGRNPFFLCYLVCALLLSIPSVLCWFREPFLVIPFEFDFFIGLFSGENGDLVPGVLEFGKCIHLLLVGLMGWAYYRLITGLADCEANLSWLELLLPTAVVTFVMFCCLPWLSPDVFLYFGSGWLNAHYNLSPFRWPISAVPGYEEDPMFANIYPAWKQITTSYGPLFIPFVSSITWLGDGSDRRCLLLIKLGFILCHLVNGGLVHGISRQLNFKPRLSVLAYLLNPFTLLNFVAWAHNDILLMTATLAAVWAILAERHLLATFFLGLGVGIKYIPLLLLPFFGIYMVRGLSPQRAVIKALGLGTVLTAVVMAPHFWYDHGNDNFWRHFSGQYQALKNFLYVLPLGENHTTEDARWVKLALKLVFLGLSSLVACRLWFRRPLTTDALFSSMVVMLLLFFAIGTPEFHEWYFGWVVCLIFWINDRSYYNLGMILPTFLDGVMIFEIRSLVIVSQATLGLSFLSFWFSLFYLYRRGRDGSWQPSPLFESKRVPDPA